MIDIIKDLEEKLKNAKKRLEDVIKQSETAKDKRDKSPEKQKLKYEYENILKQVSIEEGFVSDIEKTIEDEKKKLVDLPAGIVLKNMLKGQLTVSANIILMPNMKFTLTKEMKKDEMLMKIIKHSIETGLLA